MHAQFDFLLVLLSILVAIFASYVGLSMGQNITQSKGKAQVIWLACGALALGIGIWSMHFVGMLAFEMPGMEMGYDIPLMILSIIVAIGASALALYIISRHVVPSSSIVSGGIAMAVAISGMHYIGMYSMRMAARIEWDAFLIVLSVVIALAASFGAIFVLIKLRDKADHFIKLLAAATMMGFAISGMHYTGMLAATFIHTDVSDIETSDLVVSSGLTTTVVVMTMTVLILALASSVGQRLWTKKSRQADEDLGKSEEKFRHLVDAVKDYAIFMLDPTGHITTWNSGAQRLYGFREVDVIGKHISLFCTQFEGHQVEDELAIAREQGHFEGECQGIRKDGSKFWANVVIAPLFNVDKVLTGFSKVVRDITLVKEAERRLHQVNEDLDLRVKSRTRELEQSELQLRTIANAVPVLIAQIDRNERFLFANEAFTKWFYRDGEKMIGEPYRAVLGSLYDMAEPYLKKAWRGDVVSYERDIEHGSTVISLAITFVPEFDAQKNVRSLIIVASDITRHKDIQTELKKAKEAAEVANATKSAFLANMSHEIRTPLGAVIGFSELLMDSDLTPSERANSLEVIRRNGNLLSNIINDILDISKVEAGKLEVEKTDVSFADLMKDVGSVLDLEAEAKGISLTFTSEGTLPAQIRTDAIRLRQILLNIVGNAIKFTQKGSVSVRVKVSSSYKDSSSKLMFIVKDTGEGIKAEQIERLFTPFTQADVSTTRRFGGTGLGLVLAKKLANALGGDVVLSESVHGQGSTFIITVDPGLSEHILFQRSERTAANVVTLPKVERQSRLRSHRILLVDDSLDNQALIKKVLTLAGATVEIASNGREGVEKALEGNYSMILMDLQMPGMDGFEATKALREKGYQGPIIALTAHAMKEERQRTLRSGFNDHLTKPIDQEVLVQTLLKYVAA